MNKEKNLKDQRASLRVDTRETQHPRLPLKQCQCWSGWTQIIPCIGGSANFFFYPSFLQAIINNNNNNNDNNNNNRIQRRYSSFFTISSQHSELSPTRTLKWPRRNRVQSERLSRASVMLRATWYEGSAQLLRLTELKSHLFELFVLLADPLNRWIMLWCSRLLVFIKFPKTCCTSVLPRCKRVEMSSVLASPSACSFPLTLIWPRKQTHSMVIATGDSLAACQPRQPSQRQSVVAGSLGLGEWWREWSFRHSGRPAIYCGITGDWASHVDHYIVWLAGGFNKHLYCTIVFYS